MSAFTSLIHCSTGILSQSNQRRRRNKSHPNWKEEVKLLFADDMILYIEDPEDSSKKLLELTDEFSKVAEIQKSVAFLYVNKELTGKLKKELYSQLVEKE